MVSDKKDNMHSKVLNKKNQKNKTTNKNLNNEQAAFCSSY